MTGSLCLCSTWEKASLSSTFFVFLSCHSFAWVVTDHSIKRVGWHTLRKYTPSTNSYSALNWGKKLLIEFLHLQKLLFLFSLSFLDQTKKCNKEYRYVLISQIKLLRVRVLYYKRDINASTNSNNVNLNKKDSCKTANNKKIIHIRHTWRVNDKHTTTHIPLNLLCRQ